jgi:tRNA threonylcarbamoyladenosine biosynthesis protein TsaE
MMFEVREITIYGDEAMQDMGRRLAAALADVNGLVIYLDGDLGAGKTTLTRGLLRGFGHEGKVKSPTYTLVEEYRFGDQQLFHFDLYRLADPEELEYMGHRDMFNGEATCIVEWATQGEGYLPAADLIVRIDYVNAESRELKFHSQSEMGNAILGRLGDGNGL